MKLYISQLRDKEAEALAVKSIVESGELEIHNLVTLRRIKHGKGTGYNVNTKKMNARSPYLKISASMGKKFKEIVRHCLGY